MLFIKKMIFKWRRANKKLRCLELTKQAKQLLEILALKVIRLNCRQNKATEIFTFCSGSTEGLLFEIVSLLLSMAAGM